MKYARRAARWVTLLNATTTPVITSPTEIANLWAWYDASDISSLYQDSARTTPVASNGDPIGSWGDKSGSSRHAAQTGAGTTRPTYQTGIQNSLPAAAFDGGDFLDTSATINSFPLSIMGVALTNGTVGTNRGLVSAYHSTLFGARVIIGSSNLLNSLISPPSASRNSAAAIAANQSFVFGGIFSASVNTNILNGALLTVAHTATVVTNILSIGRTNVNTATNLANNYICETVIYNRGLTDTETLQVASYLNTKWAAY